LADFKTRVLQKTHVKSLIFIDFITQQAKNAKVMEKISTADFRACIYGQRKGEKF